MLGQPLPPPQPMPSPDRMALVPVTAPPSHQQPLPPPPPAPAAQQQTLFSPKPAELASYPPAVAKHQAVVADRDLFYDTLNKFHAALGTRLMIPTIGGKELDLHLLYIEVSARGGLEQVIKDRKWKEITVVFNFPPTTTSASYVLRKYYITLLHHYEQVYFFGAQGQVVPLPAPLPGPSPSPGHPSADNGFANHGSEEAALVVKKRKRRGTLEPTQLYGVDLGTSVGHTVTGVIDGKFEHGYLVTVSVSTEKLRGVLYHMPSGSIAPQFAAVAGMASGIGSDSAPEVRKRRRRRRKHEMPKKDPNAPKPNRSGYNFFFQEHHMRLKALHPEKDKDISRMIGELWNKQAEAEKAVYQEQGLKDKERFKREMEQYHEKLRNEAHCQGSGPVVVFKQPMVESEKNRDERPDCSTSGVAEAESCSALIEEEKRNCDAAERENPELNNGIKGQVSSRPPHDQGADG